MDGVSPVYWIYRDLQKVIPSLLGLLEYLFDAIIAHGECEVHSGPSSIG